MLHNLKYIFAISLMFAAAYKTQGADNRLQCWHCSSDTVGANDFCGEVFKEDNIPSDLKERNISVLRSCNSSINSEHERAVCRKTIEEVNGKTVIKRYCYYTNKSDPLDMCHLTPNTDKNVKRVYCQDCLTDKCNGAGQLSFLWGLLALPALYANIILV